MIENEGPGSAIVLPEFSVKDRAPSLPDPFGQPINDNPPFDNITDELDVDIGGVEADHLMSESADGHAGEIRSTEAGNIAPDVEPQLADVESLREEAPH